MGLSGGTEPEGLGPELSGDDEGGGADDGRGAARSRVPAFAGMTFVL